MATATMYDYLLKQWKLGKISAEYVEERVPKFITANQCATILSTPQEG